jgi:hypothetical protein
MRRPLLPILLLLLVGFFVLNCHASEEENVHRVLNQREEALRKRDLSLYLSCVSKSYQDRDEEFDGIQRKVAESFKTFDGIEYASHSRSIEIEGKEARVFQEFELNATRAGKKSSFSGKESLLLHKEGGDWKIVKGL